MRINECRSGNCGKAMELTAGGTRLVAGPPTGPEPVTSCFPLASVSIHPKVPWPIRLRPPSVEMVLDCSFQ